MTTATIVLTYVIAALHVWFFVLQAFLWQKPIGIKSTGRTAAEAAATAVLARNQGVYNLILAMGLAWAAYVAEFHLLFFFLAAVLLAGIVGGLTAMRKILYLQALPALVAIVLLHLGHFRYFHL